MAGLASLPLEVQLLRVYLNSHAARDWTRQEGPRDRAQCAPQDHRNINHRRTATGIRPYAIGHIREDKPRSESYGGSNGPKRIWQKQ